MTSVLTMHPASTAESRRDEVRRRLPYPVIDSDLHPIEFIPALEDFIDKVGGPSAVDWFRSPDSFGRFNNRNWYSWTVDERRARHAMHPPWWTMPAENTLDLATMALPKLLYERLGEAGIDFAVLYPNVTTWVASIPREDMRRVGVRAVNLYQADRYKDCADRMTAAAAIPLFSPKEGIEELEFAVRELGFKVALIPGYVRRPIASLRMQYPEDKHPHAARRLVWIDNFGVDSQYDYDPFWSKVVELQVPLTTHAGSLGWNGRGSWSNYMHNHLGHFASASEALVRSLFMAGVTRRFPKLRLGLLEGGVAYATKLYADLVAYWEKRGGEAIHQFDPTRVDADLLYDLYQKYGDERVRALAGSPDQARGYSFGVNQCWYEGTGGEKQPDDFSAVQIERLADIRDHFVPNFYFGVEPDDPTVAYAFDAKINPLGAKLKTLFGSDVGHWDAPALGNALDEAWELVERGVITADDCRASLFANPCEFYQGTNPAFFDGTQVESKLHAAVSGESRRRP